MEASESRTEGTVGGDKGDIRERICGGASGLASRQAAADELSWMREIAGSSDEGCHPGGRPGARPGEAPDIKEAVAELASYVKSIWAKLKPFFQEKVYGDSDDSRCLYGNDTVAVTMLITTMLRCHSRNMADGCRNSEAMASSMLYLSDQAWWPENERFTTACTETLVYRTRKWSYDNVREANAGLVKQLINSKYFERDRVSGKYYCVAVDGVHRDEKRNGRGEVLTKREKKTVALEAKLITKTGMAISLWTEDVKPYDGDMEKQDCEIEAFRRLAKKLRKMFRRYPLCLVGDALYACFPVWSICEKNGWKYITTFKEGRTPSVYTEAEYLFNDRECEGGVLQKGDGKPRYGEMKWVRGVETNTASKYRINVIQGKISFTGDLTKSGKEKKPYKGMFATNLNVEDINEADDIFCWGRRRWSIENVFKEQKHSGFGLKHRFVNETEANKVWYALMQIAWTIWQMFQRGFLLRLGARCRKMTQALWCEEIRLFILDSRIS